MATEPIKKVIKKWETERITQEQAIGKILIWLEEMLNRQAKIEARLLRLERRQ